MSEEVITETTTVESILANAEQETETTETTEEEVTTAESGNSEAAPAVKESRSIRIQARKERALRKKEAEINSKLEQVTAWEAAAGNAKQDPLAYLEQSGIDLDYLAEFLMNGEAPEEAAPDPMEEVIARLNKIDTDKAEAAEAALAELAVEKRTVLDAFHAEVSEFVVENATAFPLTNNLDDGADYVNERILEHFEKHGKLITIQQAAEAVEKEFEALAEMLSVSGTSGEQEPSRVNESGDPTQVMEKIRSLTNSMATQTPSEEEDDSDEASNARVLAILKARRG